MSELEPCGGGSGGEDDEEDKADEDEGGLGDGRCNGGGSEREVGVEVDERRREVLRKGVFEFSRDFRNAIKRPFRKTRKTKEKRRGDGETIRFPSAARRGRKSGRGGGRGGGCYVCFLRPRTEESPETPTSDPNSDSFSFEMLRTLIEKNDFYCQECNPHI